MFHITYTITKNITEMFEITCSFVINDYMNVKLLLLNIIKRIFMQTQLPQLLKRKLDLEQKYEIIASFSVELWQSQILNELDEINTQIAEIIDTLRFEIDWLLRNVSKGEYSRLKRNRFWILASEHFRTLERYGYGLLEDD